MSKHTPGPWRYAMQPGTTGLDLLVVGPHEDDCDASAVVARIPGTEHMPREEDATLIAAAPDLLAALEDLVRDVPMCPHESAPEACRYCFARATIAKARGGK